MQIVTDTIARSLYRPIPADTHKGRQGHSLLVAGSYGKMGAAVLAARSCLASGAGLVTVFAPECGYTILQTAVPEAMVLTDEAFRHLTHIEMGFAPQAIGIGPGIGTHHDTGKALFHFLESANVPLVADADALNLLSTHTDAFALLPKRSVLTPHPKEFQRMVGEWRDEDERIKKAVMLSGVLDAVIVLKGAPTLIVDGKQVFQNTSGNAALATGGTGDCLTGIITALLAQGYASLDAALLGVFLHGRAADIALPETGYEAFTASQLPLFLGKAFRELYPTSTDSSTPHP